MKINGDMNSFISKKTTNNKKDEVKLGLFHLLENEMKNSLLTVGREDAEVVRRFDRSEIDKQRAAKKKKEKLLLKYKMDKATESYIDAIYYHEIGRQ